MIQLLIMFNKLTFSHTDVAVYNVALVLISDSWYLNVTILVSFSHW